ncbi:MAG: ATP-binding protein, partial [Chloroflexi bacterium]|nr:ATP-binding protein [Chloroflexota bacterium]
QADDYRGVPAITNFTWMPARNMCLVVKVDQAEAFAPVATFGRWVILAGGIALLVVAGIGVGLARTITRPVRALQAGAARFGRGELDVRLPETAGDELGALAREFNIMAAALSREQTLLRHRLERMYALSSDLICAAGFDGYLKEVNPAFERVLGFRQDEMMMSPFIEFVHPDDRAATQAVVATLADGQTLAAFENRYRCKDGSWKWLLWNASSDPREQLIFAMAHDVTERKEADTKLKKTLADVERSNKELEQFAYVASHDLQEPLRMVSSYTQLLAKRFEGQLDRDAQDFIGYAVDGANRMQRLIQDLLMYSRVTTRGRPYELVDLHQVLGEAVANLQAAISESGALVSNGDLPALIADRTQLVQVFQNLIGNAIKFHKEVEPPRVHISARRDGEEWIISVKDNGIGIDPKHFSRLFVIFQRLHGPQQYPGTGIGLALCQRIVARHGGRIWVESAPGQGSEFLFTLKA